MARAQRIEYEGAVYHVTARGNERREIFRDDADREHFLRVLGESVGRFEVRVASDRDLCEAVAAISRDSTAS